MKNFVKLLHKERYIHWEVSPKEHVLLFKNDNRFLLSHSNDDSLVSVVFDINEDEVEVKEVDGVEIEVFDFYKFYTNIQDITRNIDGILI
ncbi:hypothetical protein ACTOJ1_000624 [Shigella flexneri]